jgi:hypothetical protein
MLVFRMRKFRPSRDESSVQLEQASSKRINCLFASNKANRKGIKLVKHLVLSSGKNFANNSSASNVVVMKNNRIACFKEMRRRVGQKRERGIEFRRQTHPSAIFMVIYLDDFTPN